jgi:hypothetical protein
MMWYTSYAGVVTLLEDHRNNVRNDAETVHNSEALNIVIEADVKVHR